MQLGTLGPNLLGNMLAGKRVIRGGAGGIQAVEGILRAGQNF